MLARAAALLAFCFSAPQAGDHPGEAQPPLPADLVVPPAPARSPDEELASFRVAKGFRVELVASEPLVHDPIVAVFDEDGRLWVVEMRGYMPDVDGRGEREPVGSIAVLDDEDGDGRMDARSVFLDELVLPRAVLPMRGGALVIAPPEMLFCRDTDGDGRADAREVVERGLGGIESPEHAANGPMLELDDWIRLSNHPWRYRFEDGAWKREAVAGGGQWGITKDDAGRVYFDTNSDPLRGDLFPSRYAVRNPNHGLAAGVNVRLADDLRVWPARVNPGINRGYQAGMLRDGRLASFTGACAPHVDRGGAFPPGFAGNAFVAEPCGNLVKRYALDELDDGSVKARAVDERDEFLTSTDERFRPVNLAGGPDGALYVVDMYRGLIQHRLFVTSFLREQVEERGLERPIGLGRIWRVAWKGASKRARPKLSAASWTELAAHLGDANGWWRDQAQRIFVEEGRGSSDARELASEAFDAPKNALGRLHALWALEGMGALDRARVVAALGDEDERVRHSGVRVSERFLARGDGELLALVARVGASDPSGRIRHQVLLSLGEAQTEAADRALLALSCSDASTPERRSAVLCGLFGRELAFVEALVANEAWRAEIPGRADLLRLAARCVAVEGRTDHVARLFELAASDPPLPAWQRRALFEGVAAGRPSGPDGEPAPIRLARRPQALDALAAGAQDEAMQRAIDAIAWPGRAGFEAVEIPPLDARSAALFEQGRALYADVCAACHQPSGLGEAGKAPPLRGSPYLLGDERRLVRIVTNGLVGPIDVRGERWEMEMPAWTSSDEQLAAVLTYARREWGHGADPLSPGEVHELRAQDAPRRSPWTADELE